MVILLRRRYLRLAVLVLLTGTALCSVFCPKYQPVMKVEESPAVVILDAGHGGADGGAVSADGVVESVINWQIVCKTEALFRFLGQHVVLTRTEEDGLYNEDSITIRQKKVADTRNRVERINSYDNAALISIHQNALPSSPKTFGGQAFYNGVDNGTRLADAIQKALNDGINRGNEKCAAPISQSVYIMAHAACPAALVECGFLSNESDTVLLQQDTHQRKLASAIVCGYLIYKKGE